MIIHGDSLQRLKILPENSVDAIVTDPPYGLSFMGKKWDYDVPQVDLWKECMRVMKPGAFLLSFAGTRTYHRMAVNIEDAGFEIRDMISWLYGSGFPKSHNIGKAVDKLQGNEREVVGKKIVKGGENLNKLSRENKNDDVEAKGCGAYGKGAKQVNIEIDDTKGDSDWEGWGTALKPACEPIVVARKPLSEKNVALNVLKWGTGGINIDGCRVETEENLNGGAYSGGQRCDGDWKDKSGFKNDNLEKFNQPQGRFPANIILDEEAGEILDEQTGELKSGKMKAGTHRKNTDYCSGKTGLSQTIENDTIGDKGGASRFFYCAKASKSERNLGCEELEEVNLSDRGEDGMRDKNSIVTRHTKTKNNHPTVKPIKLMEYLVKLVSKEGATVLDPFLGSGTTAIACIKLNRKWIGIEREEDYIEIIKARIKPFMKDEVMVETKVDEKVETEPIKEEITKETIPKENNIRNLLGTPTKPHSPLN